MQEIGSTIGKYFMSGLLVLLGLGLLILSPGQNLLFKLGGLAIFVVGLLGGLYTKGLINRNVQVIIAIVVALGAAVFAYLDYQSIDDKLQYEKKLAHVNTNVIQRLKDIRKAQLAYQRETGMYTGSFDTLISFLENGEMTLIKRLGALPDTIPSDEMARELGLIDTMPPGMSDEEAIRLGLLIRDTIQVPVLTNVFDESDRESRKTKFYLDSLPYVPFANHKFEMNAGKIDAGGVTVPVFEVFDPKPFADPLKVGSMTEASTSGNWNE